MARHRGANFYGYVHNPYSLLVLTICLVLIESPAFARPPLEKEYGVGAEEKAQEEVTINAFASSWLTLVLSLCFLVILASFLAYCGAGGCCAKIKLFGRGRQAEPPLSFSNPMTEPGSTMMIPISQIDVRALEQTYDPIVFEPLPTVHDLTPIANKLQSDKTGHFGQRNSVIPIVPFSPDDSAIYAHDWFEEPLNNFPRNNVEYVKEIGKGWFGQVIEAEARDIVPFARKIRVVVKLLREDANGVEQMRFLYEARMYRDANHGNILKLMGYSIEKLPFLLIMEHCPQGDLKSFLISNVIRAEMLNSQGTIVKMALDVSKGLEWLHNAGFVHPDLAARNCQVGSENRVIIGDYGLGTQIYKDDYHWSSSVAIPLRWTAPETLHCTSNLIQILKVVQFTNDEKVTESSNIWTLGVVIWEICEFGKLPYFELADDEVISRVIVDKNYFLGRPTLPSMTEKEELYKIMSSCWEPEMENRPRLYTIVRQLEELHRTFVASTVTSPVQDEFEAKWEQLGSRSNPEDDKRRKKNVSFLDLERHVKSLESSSLPADPETNRNASYFTTGSFGESSDLSRDVVLGEQSKDVDLDEEQWTKKIERGDITQKVLEKSQSVQDLMVLTHFEQGDDMDSLLFVTNKSPPKSSALNQSGKEPMNDTSSANNNNSNNNNNVSNSVSNSTLRKSCSEPAIDALSLANSSHTLTPSSICDSQSSTLVPQDQSPFNPPENTASTPNTNRPSGLSGVDINVIAATPNPDVEIKIINATPSPSVKQVEINGTSAEKVDDMPGKNLNPIQRKLHFKFDSTPPTSKGEFRQRQTSTPVRSGSTPSPRISDFGDGEENGDEDVFETSSGYFMEGTFGLSPINQHYVSASSFNSSNHNKTSKSDSWATSSVQFGASDDHELGSYQGVKSTLRDIFNPEYNEEDDEKNNDTTRKALKTDIKPRRILFENGEGVESVNGKDDGVDPSLSMSSSLTLNGTFENTVKESVKKLESEAEEQEPAVEENDFWSQQFKSLKMAADNTRELFQTGLDEKDINPNTDEDRKFVEDIEADVEELGSLVLHDLEEPDSLQMVIKETREAIKPDAGVSAKLAFEQSSKGSDNEENEESHEKSINSSAEVDEGESLLWDVNNSIEIRKDKVDTTTGFKGSKESDPVDTFDFEEGTEFVPSKWNQNLVPSRSAIKSPEQPSKSGMKKSVSFEMKKTQLVYEYPPPSVASDSEEEDKIMLPISSASSSSALPSSSMMASKVAASNSAPFAASLDWELTQEELENVEMSHENWDDDIVPQPGDPMDVYRISGFNEDAFQIRPSAEPFVFSPQSTQTSTLGELRHTRDRLRLDLSRGEANFLDDDSNKLSNPAKLDSGVGSSTNVSPFNNCDILTKRSKSGD